MPTFAQLKATRLRAGYTRHVIVECGDADYYGWIRPAQSLTESATITLIEDAENSRILNFKGADVTVRDLED